MERAIVGSSSVVDRAIEDCIEGEFDLFVVGRVVTVVGGSFRRAGREAGNLTFVRRSCAEFPTFEDDVAFVIQIMWLVGPTAGSY